MESGTILSIISSSEFTPIVRSIPGRSDVRGPIWRAAKESDDIDVIFKSFETTDKKALENPVKINQPYWTKLKISDDKGNVLLTSEEQKFINDKNININKKDNED